MVRSISFIPNRQPASSAWSRRLAMSASAFVIVTALLTGIGLVIDRVRHEPVVPLPPSAGGLEQVDPSTQPLVIDPGWLVDRRANATDPPLIIDLSSRTQYETGHIPGAIHGWWQDGMELHAPVYGRLISDRSGPMARQRWLQTLGVTRDRSVVVYDDTGGRAAARLVWILEYMGIDDASVLDGGLAAWKRFGLPVTSAETVPSPVDVISADRDLSRLMATDELIDRLGDPSLSIVDVRGDAELADDLNGTIRTGRLPRAIALPWTSLYRDDGVQLRSSAQLREIFTAAGLALEDEIVLYGQFGIDTGRVWLALAAAGYERVRIYDDGWAYWSSRDELPIEPLPDDTVIYASTVRTANRDVS